MIRFALESRLPIFREVVVRQDHDGNIRIVHVDLFGELKPIFSGQPNIHKDDIGMKGINFAKQFLSMRFLAI